MSDPWEDDKSRTCRKVVSLVYPHSYALAAAPYEANLIMPSLSVDC